MLFEVLMKEVVHVGDFVKCHFFLVTNPPSLSVSMVTQPSVRAKEHTSYTHAKIFTATLKSH